MTVLSEVTNKVAAKTKARPIRVEMENGAIHEWMGVWLQAVALSWEDPSFREQLIDNPRAAFAERFPWYELPSDLDLRVKPAQYDPEGRLPDTQICYPLPDPPERLEDRPLLLAQYSASGASFPFTCLCLVC